MRLIDADEVNNHIIGYVDLRDCPTVKAIPIEWIYLWRLKNMDKCPVDYIPFSELLKDWEEENGDSKA